MGEKEDGKIKTLISDKLGDLDDTKIDKYAKMIKDCLLKKTLIKVCNIERIELDLEILQLLFVGDGKPFDGTQRKDKEPEKTKGEVQQALDLALSWNRAEVFENIIRQSKYRLVVLSLHALISLISSE